MAHPSTTAYMRAIRTEAYLVITGLVGDVTHPLLRCLQIGSPNGQRKKTISTDSNKEVGTLSKFNGASTVLVLGYGWRDLPMQTVDIRILYHAENDWSLWISGKLHSHLSSAALDELIEYTLVFVEVARSEAKTATFGEEWCARSLPY
jgi:hypothetical protein